MEEQKIKQDEIDIGSNILRILKAKGYGQTELVRKLQLREIRDMLETSYDELLG